MIDITVFRNSLEILLLIKSATYSEGMYIVIAIFYVTVEILQNSFIC